MSSELCVYSSSSKKNYQLSNFFDSYIKVGDHVYPSVEHAFQAMQHEDPIPWTTQGKFANWDFVLPRVNEGRKAPITGKNLRKKFMTGALARMVADRPLMFQLKRKPLEHPYSEDLWMTLFEAKFCAPPPEGGHAEGELLDILLKTSGTLLLKDPHATDDTVMAGRFDRVLNRVVGQNKMGQMLTKFRDSKRPKRGIEVVANLTLEQALNKKFKEAQEKGMVIELDQDEFLPHDWEQFSITQKLTYAMEKNWTLQKCAKYIHMPNDPSYSPTPNEPEPQPNKEPKEPVPITKTQLHTGLQSASGIVLTWSHSVESGNYVNPVGTKGRGFTLQDLEKLQRVLPDETDLHTISGPVTGHVLVIKKFVPLPMLRDMTAEVKALPNYDTMGWFRGKCLNKSRWNTQLTDRDVQGNIPEPNKDLRKSSENSFENAPKCKEFRDYLSDWTHLGMDTKNLKAEANIYGITKPEGKPPNVAPGIGPHVDGERNTVIATNLMGQRMLCLCPYLDAQPAGPRTQILIQPGDVYIFDTIAAGTSIRGPHIRHWASGGRGDEKYIQNIENQLVKKVKAMKGPLTEASKYIVEHGKQQVHPSLP